MQHAHQSLVIHRDLKPSNILVSADGSVHLLDFGIAKLIDPAAAAPHTRLDSRMMTPEYASPEQVRGDPLGTSSDIYSLGVLLYELLCGRAPYRFRPDRRSTWRRSSASRIRSAPARVSPGTPPTSIRTPRPGSAAPRSIGSPGCSTATSTPSS